MVTVPLDAALVVANPPWIKANTCKASLSLPLANSLEIAVCKSVAVA
ncbi:hypothetical protein [Pediococcus claussenii]|nr:hypothetical protein [Pediococcus claussenii]